MEPTGAAPLLLAPVTPFFPVPSSDAVYLLGLSLVFASVAWAAAGWEAAAPAAAVAGAGADHANVIDDYNSPRYVLWGCGRGRCGGRPSFRSACILEGLLFGCRGVMV